MRVCFSGTFNVLHKGHKLLIEKAFQAAGDQGKVFIGITEGKLLENKKYKKPLSQRMSILKSYLQSKGYQNQVEIVVIRDQFKLAISGDYDAMITSPETKENAIRINEKRVEQNKKPLQIIEVPYVLAEDQKKISSTRILNKEIDEEGHTIS
jgi:pantetheine-phosphate adenylyltransferase